MERSWFHLKSMALGFLLGMGLLLGAAQLQKPSEPVERYQIATAGATWIIDTATGDVWQLEGEEGTSSFTWLHAGKPPAGDSSPRKTGY